MAKDKNKPQAAGDPGGRIALADIADKLTINGRPVFDDIKIDPDTGDLLSYTLQPDIKEELEAQAAAAAGLGTEAAQRITTLINGIIGGADNQQIAETLREWHDSVKSFNDEFIGNLQTAEMLLKELRELRPYLDAELKRKKYSAKNFDDIAHRYTVAELLDELSDPESDLTQIIKAARAAASNDPEGQLQKIRYNTGTNEIKTSTDKLTNVFYSIAAPKSKTALAGQREMIPLKYERDNAEKEITLFYDYAFDKKLMQSLGLDLSFDSYDYFVAAVCDNLLLQGNKVVSLTKIFHEMNEGSPTGSQLEDLYNSLVKGATTTIYMDDREVREAWGLLDKEDTYSEIISPVMPLQIHGKKFKANGKIAKAQIVINNLSPFFALSQDIGHYSTWKKEILMLYTGRKTKRYYSVLHFLMTQISWLRNPKSNRSNKITYAALYSYTGAKTTRDKQLSRDMAYRLLEEVFKPAGYVKSYIEDNKGDPGIKIVCTINEAAALPNKK